MTRRLTLLATAAALVAVPLASAGAAQMQLQSIFPKSLPLLGKPGWDVADRIRLITNGSVDFEVQNPGELVSTGEVWDAVSTGAVEASWYSIGFAEGVIPSAPLFTTFPFGPDIREYSAWWYNGGGKELWAEITAPHGVTTIHCGVLVPEASGWFREPIESVEDFQGIKMRFFGLGASVMGKLGVEAQSMGVADTVTALNTGAIEAAEFGFPVLDELLGLYEHADHYYFPGWHQQTSFLSLIINTDVWEGFSASEQAAIEDVCAASMMRTTAEGEAVQLAPLAKMQAENGVQVHRWSDEMLDAFRGAWAEVVEEKSAEDADFKRAWESISAFRESYDEWESLGYLK